MKKLISGRRASQPRRRAGLSWAGWAAVLTAIALLLMCFVLPAVTRSREAARRTSCKCHLKQIGLALHNYHDINGEFPPAYTVDANGKPLHSWRTLLLPYLDQKPLYDKIDLSKPWNDPANAEAYQTVLRVYRCSSDAHSAPDKTSYLAIVTSDSCLLPEKSRTIKQITDGTSNTLMVIEVPHDQSVHWMSPQDADEKLLESFGPASKESHSGGRHGLLADGTVRFLSQNIDRKTLHALCTATGNDTVGDF